ncbi:RNA polymerase sigma factor [Massilia glaciei]|nr:sigma-70 family RNA polymerase sigma factor [Massilia glaciei]
MPFDFSNFLKRRRDNEADFLVWRAIVRGGRERDSGCAKLYQRYGASVRRTFLAGGLDRETAEELFQEVVINVVVCCAQFTPDQSFRAWLFSIAHNVYVDHLRYRAARRNGDHAHPISMDAVHPYSDRELGALENFGLRDCVRQAFIAFEQSHPERAQIMTLSVLEGLCSKEVAHFLERSDAATREYLRQCRIKMRSYFAHCHIYLAGEET